MILVHKKLTRKGTKLFTKCIIYVVSGLHYYFPERKIFDNSVATTMNGGSDAV